MILLYKQKIYVDVKQYIKILAIVIATYRILYQFYKSRQIQVCRNNYLLLYSRIFRKNCNIFIRVENVLPIIGFY